MSLSESELVGCCAALLHYDQYGEWQHCRPKFLEELINRETDATFRPGERLAQFRRQVAEQAILTVLAFHPIENGKKIPVPHSHINDFKSHLGSWAVFENPNVVPGQIVLFELGQVEVVKARVIDCGHFDPMRQWFTIRFETLATLKGEYTNA